MTRSLIESILVGAGFEVRSCADAATARQISKDFDPDLAILDVSLGQGSNGVQLGYILEQRHPAMAIMYLTQYPTAFLSQPKSAAHVENKVVLHKDSVNSPEDVLHGVESALRGYRTGTEDLVDDQMRCLTELQWEILQMMASGMTNTAIAQRRGTSERAVERQLKLIYAALGIDIDQLSNARVLATRRYLNAIGNTSVATDLGDDLPDDSGA